MAALLTSITEGGGGASEGAYRDMCQFTEIWEAQTEKIVPITDIVSENTCEYISGFNRYFRKPFSLDAFGGTVRSS